MIAIQNMNTRDFLRSGISCEWQNISNGGKTNN